ncbi:MAG: hypothetical protein GY765_16125 [bacterium]|nr:hypothetical protein [bacterium]
MNKKNKIRLILLEGESDRLFFNAFKNQYARDLFDVSLLKAQNQNFNKIRKELDISRKVFKYKAVWLVMDLKTQKMGTRRHYESCRELLLEYEEKLKGYDTSDMVIMVRDLECWVLLYFDKYSDTERIDDAEKKLSQLMAGNSGSKPRVLQRLMKKNDFWERLFKNKSNNKSFCEFIRRTDEALR